MTHTFEVGAADLKRLIDKTRFAISTEETRYYLNGIYLHVAATGNKPTLRAVATDGHRLAQVELPRPAGSDGMPGVIIPRKTVNELHRLIEDGGTTVTIGVSPAKIRFEAGTVTLTSKLIDGTFPDYGRVIPQGNDKELKVSNAEFMHAVDRVSTIASERGRAVKLNITGDKLVLSVTNPEGGSATEEIDVEYGSAPIEIGFNARYLLDIAGQLEGESAVLQARRSRRADDGARQRRRERALRADADAGVMQDRAGASRRDPASQVRADRRRVIASSTRLSASMPAVRHASAPLGRAHRADQLPQLCRRRRSRSGPAPVVLLGANGAGKTNLLEASRCWRRAAACGARLCRAGAPRRRRRLGGRRPRHDARRRARHRHRAATAATAGTGDASAQAASCASTARRSGAGALADHVDMVWLTPAMDGLFTGPAAERRAFLDRLVLCFDAGHAPRSARFERAMRQRNRCSRTAPRTACCSTGSKCRWPRPASPSPRRGSRRSRRCRRMTRAATRARCRLAVPVVHAGARGHARERSSPAHAAVDVEDRYRARLARRARARPRRRPHARRPAPLRSRRRPRAQVDAGAAVARPASRRRC